MAETSQSLSDLDSDSCTGEERNEVALTSEGEVNLGQGRTSQAGLRHLPIRAKIDDRPFALITPFRPVTPSEWTVIGHRTGPSAPADFGCPTRLQFSTRS